MQLNGNPEEIHVWLVIGQYILVPVAAWALRSLKNSIVNDLKEHVDITMAAHEKGESGKFMELSERIGRIEAALIDRALSSPKQRGRAARDSSGRWVSRSSNPTTQ